MIKKSSYLKARNLAPAGSGGRGGLDGGAQTSKGANIKLRNFQLIFQITSISLLNTYR